MSGKTKTILFFTFAGIALVAAPLVGFGVTQAAFSHTTPVTNASSAVLTATPSGNRYLYLKPTSYWNVDSAKFYLYTFNSANNSQHEWYASLGSLNSGNNELFYFDQPKYDKIVFIRGGSSSTLPNLKSMNDWLHDDSHIWNKSGDLDTPNNTDKIVYTISSTGIDIDTAANGSWGEYS